ncbi:MAG: hypothetical protein JST54_05780 [Deltaproteobacteria bacterium]|nr:hypothetical protein [Deltaproteobacteria bacterium]
MRRHGAGLIFALGMLAVWGCSASSTTSDGGTSGSTGAATGSTTGSSGSTGGSGGSSGTSGATNVRLLYLVTKAGSSCITDPPGSQANVNSICQTFAVAITQSAHPEAFCEPDGNPHPQRVCALYNEITRLKDNANVEAALVPYESEISGGYPATTDFAPVGDNNLGAWVTAINDWQGSLGQANNWQGALAAALARITDDISHLAAADKSNTRYLVVFIADGMPFPFCASNDALPASQLASASSPDLTWPDSPGAGCPVDGGGAGCVCNDGNPSISGLVAGGNLDQPTDLYALADQLKALGSSVGGVQLDTVLLWNDANYATLATPEQQDLFGLSATDAHTAAVHFMSELATHGGGASVEKNPPTGLDLSALPNEP